MCPKEHRRWHPVEERRAQQRGRIFGHENDLEDRRLHAGLDAVTDVARQVAQEVGVQNVVFLTGTGIQPDIKDKVLCPRFMSPKPMPVSKVKPGQSLTWWLLLPPHRRQANAKTHRVPLGIWKTPSSLVMAYSTPFLTTPKTPCSTLKNSSCKRCMCLPSQVSVKPFSRGIHSLGWGWDSPVLLLTVGGQKVRL